MYAAFIRRRTGMLAALLLVLWSSTALGDLRIASWNVLHGGWANSKAMNQVAHIANHFDFIAMQEVMNDEFMSDLTARLEKNTGESWSWMASHTVGRSSYKEAYAFLFRDSAVEYDSGAVVFLDHADDFAREPYSAQFRARESGQVFAVGTVHVTFGDSISDRLPEIDSLADYWGWLEETYPDATVLLTGDFNMPPQHDGWDALRASGAIPSIMSGKSTLGTTEGKWSSLYDNIWKSDPSWKITDRGILAFPDLVPLTHVESRSRISDHAPVYVGLGGASITPETFDGTPVKPSTAPSCINLNKSPASLLADLPRIGEVRADLIVEGRPWASPAALDAIKGIGAATAANIADSGLLCH